MSNKLRSVFSGIPVMVTGHTGFKGSWLSIWLLELGANVIGYSLDPPTNPNNFSLCKLSKKMFDIRGDIRDIDKLLKSIQEHKPEIIFHLAAQPIVLTSLEQPRETFETNLMGTVNVLESARRCSCVKSIVVITSDKCYKDQESIWGYKEDDPLGGKDPYSASKGMAELAVSSYQKSFFSIQNKSSISVASARAGNVIGGGDFADFRLVPDSMRALMAGEKIKVRNPDSVRPWQNILAPLSGYLFLAAKLQEERHVHADAWNFGPLENIGITSKQIVEKAIEFWGSGGWEDVQKPDSKKETKTLRVNWDKAAHHLQWAPAYDWETGLKETVSWFKEFDRASRTGQDIDLYELCVNQIKEYTAQASKKNITWAL